MATLNVTNSFSNNNIADALQVNQNFADVKAFVESNVVHVDGAVKAGVGALDFALTGIIVPYVGAAAPTGWLLCRGQLVSKATYAALYAAVGPNAFGTDTATDFYLPNLQGRVPVGVSTTDTDFERADVGGAKTHTLTVGEMPSHTHTQQEHTHTQAAHTHLVNGTLASSTSHLHNNLNDYLSTGTNGGGINGSQSPNAIVSAQPAINGSIAVNDSTGGGGAHNNLQPYIALNFIVKT